MNGFIDRAIAQDCDKGPCEAIQGTSGVVVVSFLHSEREKGQETAQNDEEGGIA